MQLTGTYTNTNSYRESSQIPFVIAHHWFFVENRFSEDLLTFVSFCSSNQFGPRFQFFFKRGPSCEKFVYP